MVCVIWGASVHKTSKMPRLGFEPQGDSSEVAFRMQAYQMAKAAKQDGHHRQNPHTAGRAARLASRL